MVSVSVRRNRREPVGRNARPDDPRHNRAYPHPANPGLFEQVDGWYDWAGRRLFLADGSPDPMTPGAYRYQTRPDLCDLDAPDSDPWSPRYEPAHLRHRPGDTWIIDRGRPRDPDDPGPFGSPGWRPDPRTGRHRRNELPDPIPPWEATEDEDEAAESEAGGAEPPWRLRWRTSTPAPEPGPEAPAPTGRPRLLDSADRPTPSPGRKTRFWHEEGEDEAGGEVAQEDSWRFEKLREDAWDRFIIKSSELAAAHWANRRALDSQHRWLVAAVLRLVRWMTSVFKGRNKNELVAPSPARPPLPRQAQPPTDRAPQPMHTGQATQRDRAEPEARPVPGAQMAQAIRSVQAARVRLAARTTQASEGEAVREAQSEPTGVGREAAQAARGAAPRSAAAADDAAHWRNRPRQERPRPSPLPYIARWEQAFDAHRAFGEVAL